MQGILTRFRCDLTVNRLVQIGEQRLAQCVRHRYDTLMIIFVIHAGIQGGAFFERLDHGWGQFETQEMHR